MISFWNLIADICAVFGYLGINKYPNNWNTVLLGFQIAQKLKKSYLRCRRTWLGRSFRLAGEHTRPVCCLEEKEGCFDWSCRCDGRYRGSLEHLFLFYSPGPLAEDTAVGHCWENMSENRDKQQSMKYDTTEFNRTWTEMLSCGQSLYY